jgi:mycoredoxin
MQEITVYWRPMCGYCEQLKTELSARGVDFFDVDIWTDRDQAEVVRAATGGDEIVPTVRVGEAVLINPSVDEVLAATGT